MYKNRNQNRLGILWYFPKNLRKFKYKQKSRKIINIRRWNYLPAKKTQNINLVKKENQFLYDIIIVPQTMTALISILTTTYDFRKSKFR